MSEGEVSHLSQNVHWLCRLFGHRMVWCENVSNVNGTWIAARRCKRGCHGALS